MQVPTRTIPGVGTFQHICDACSKPLGFVVYKGRDGEYCSNNCYDAKEDTMSKKAKKTKITTEQTEETPAVTETQEGNDTPETKKESKPIKKSVAKKAVKSTKKATPPAKGKAAAKKTASKPATKASGDKIEVVGIPGVKVYRVGTANAAVYSMLADCKVHKLQDCYNAASKAGAKYEKDALWFVTNDGRKVKAWEVVKDKDAGTVKMVKS